MPPKLKAERKADGKKHYGNSSNHSLSFKIENIQRYSYISKYAFVCSTSAYTRHSLTQSPPHIVVIIISRQYIITYIVHFV